MTARFVWLLENGFATCAKLPADCPNAGIRLKDGCLGAALLAEHKLDADQQQWSLAPLTKQFPPPEGSWRRPRPVKAPEIEAEPARDPVAISGVSFWSE
jgi:hypothetical protein